MRDGARDHDPAAAGRPGGRDAAAHRTGDDGSATPDAGHRREGGDRSAHGLTAVQRDALVLAERHRLSGAELTVVLGRPAATHALVRARSRAGASDLLRSPPVRAPAALRRPTLDRMARAAADGAGGSRTSGEKVREGPARPL